MSQNDNPYGYVSSPSSPEFISPPPTPDAQSQSYTQPQPRHPLVPLSSDEDEEDQPILSPLPVQFPPPAAALQFPSPEAAGQFPPPAAAAPLQAIAAGQLPAAALPQQQQPQIMVYPAIAYSTQEDPRNQPRSFMEMSQRIQQQNSDLLRKRGPTSRKGGTRRRYKKRKSKYTTNKHPIKSKKNKVNKKKTRRRSRYY